MTRCIVIPACLSHLRRRQAKGILRHSVIPAKAGIQSNSGCIEILPILWMPDQVRHDEMYRHSGLPVASATQTGERYSAPLCHSGGGRNPVQDPGIQRNNGFPLPITDHSSLSLRLPTPFPLLHRSLLGDGPAGKLITAFVLSMTRMPF